MSSPAFIADAEEALGPIYDQFGTEASWAPAAGGAATPCTVIKTSSTAEIGFGQGNGRVAKNMINVRRSDVAQVAEGDRVQIAQELFQVQSEPEADAFSLEWICEVAAVRTF